MDGCRIIDKTEQLAIDRVCELFNCKYANVQPHSGANANTAVQFALAKPGSVIMGMSLNSGGHLTHGAKPTFSGKHYKAIQYEVDANTYEIDYDALEDFIVKNKPKIFIAGASAYSREINFKKIREIINKAQERINNEIYADRTIFDGDIPGWIEDAKIYFMVDMAHIAGLVAAGLHQSPIPYADVVTSTTHKTLRGPRGGIILTNNEEIAKKINSAVFPGIQGGPLENIIAAKAVCFGEALKPEFKVYMEKVVHATRILALSLMECQLEVLTDGTDNHLLLLDLRKTGITGQELETRLEEIGITANKNAIPFDKESKLKTSGLRLGTAAIVSRGLDLDDIALIGKIIGQCVGKQEEFDAHKNELKYQVQKICQKYPLYAN